MKIARQPIDRKGVLPVTAYVEGRFGLLTAPPVDASYNYGDREDLPGFKVPADATEAAYAFLCLRFAEDNRDLPIYEGMPGEDTYQLRDGLGNSSPNLPADVTFRSTYPKLVEGQTIASGTMAVALEGGAVTLPSGSYVYNASLETAGALLEVLNTADDGASAGMLSYTANGAISVASVREYDSSNGELTVDLFTRNK